MVSSCVAVASSYKAKVKAASAAATSPTGLALRATVKPSVAIVAANDAALYATKASAVTLIMLPMVSRLLSNHVNPSMNPGRPSSALSTRLSVRFAKASPNSASETPRSPSETDLSN